LYATKDKYIESGTITKGTTNRLYLELVACDDWASIASWALPYIAEYGVPAVKSLYNKFVKKYDNRATSGEVSGFRPPSS